MTVLENVGFLLAHFSGKKNSLWQEVLAVG